MSKMGNYVVGLQENPDYERGWKLAETGEFPPKGATEAFQLGWRTYFDELHAP